MRGDRYKIAVNLIADNTVDGVCRASKSSLARKLHKDFPSEFDSFETARYVIRDVTGATGKKRDQQVKTRIEWRGFKLPEPEKNDYSKVVINQKRLLILSDIHFPYYDKTALTTAINYGIDYKPDCIVLDGDIIDCYQLSNFDRDPRQRRFSYELDMARSFIAQLVELFPKARIIFKLGNHCERYERIILSRVPEFVELKMFSMASVLHFEQTYKIEVISNKRLMTAGNLNIGHGHEFAKGFVAPVNPARGFFMKAKSNFIGGHHHRTSEHVEQDINGKITACWSMGCLSELNPHYMPINNWNHGFATVEMDGEDFEVHNLKIINGKIR